MKIRETETRPSPVGFSQAAFARVRALPADDPLAIALAAGGVPPSGTQAVPDDTPEHDWRPAAQETP